MQQIHDHCFDFDRDLVDRGRREKGCFKIADGDDRDRISLQFVSCKARSTRRLVLVPHPVELLRGVLCEIPPASKIWHEVSGMEKGIFGSTISLGGLLNDSFFTDGETDQFLREFEQEVPKDLLDVPAGGDSTATSFDSTFSGQHDVYAYRS